MEDKSEAGGGRLFCGRQGPHRGAKRRKHRSSLSMPDFVGATPIKK
jgi:hypothetical protein